MRGKAGHLRLVESTKSDQLPPGASQTAYRTREYLTEKEMAVLLEACGTRAAADASAVAAFVRHRYHHTWTGLTSKLPA